nr:hypothetical protein Itr_chr01CG13590 [Ipomoea trifida]
MALVGVATRRAGRTEATWIPLRRCCLSILSGDVAAGGEPGVSRMRCGGQLLAFGIAIVGAARCGVDGLVCVFALSSPLGRRRPALVHGDDEDDNGGLLCSRLGSKRRPASASSATATCSEVARRRRAGFCFGLLLLHLRDGDEACAESGRALEGI